jgi:hypothetical protein
MKRPPIADLIRNNVFFDTFIYHLPGIELLVKVVPADNILFGSKMVGAVRGIDPGTGQYSRISQFSRANCEGAHNLRRIAVRPVRVLDSWA